MKLYPLQFEPILKERIWGGTKLKTYLTNPYHLILLAKVGKYLPLKTM
jgi:hypothetical protein